MTFSSQECVGNTDRRVPGGTGRPWRHVEFSRDVIQSKTSNLVPYGSKTSNLVPYGFRIDSWMFYDTDRYETSIHAYFFNCFTRKDNTIPVIIILIL